VLYYADVPRFPGIIRIGRFARSAVGLITALPSPTAVTIARSADGRS